jgi:hypothetical protein
MRATRYCFQRFPLDCLAGALLSLFMSEPIIPAKTYFKTWAALLALLLGDLSDTRLGAAG